MGGVGPGASASGRDAAGGDEACSGANREAFQGAAEGGPIFDAWSDEPWVIDGVSVRVSLACFSGTNDTHRPEMRFDGEPADEVHSDLTAKRNGAGTDLIGAKRLPANIGVAFRGDTKGGPFDASGDLTREWLRLPANPNGRPNADVLHSSRSVVPFGAKLDSLEIDK